MSAGFGNTPAKHRARSCSVPAKMSVYLVIVVAVVVVIIAVVAVVVVVIVVVVVVVVLTMEKSKLQVVSKK